MPETTTPAPDAGAVEARTEVEVYAAYTGPVRYSRDRCGWVVHTTNGYRGALATDPDATWVRARFSETLDTLARVTAERDELIAERDRLAAEREADAKLAAYGLAVLRLWHYDEDRYDLDGGDVQEIAVQAGVVAAVRRATPCGEHCACAEVSQRGETVDCLVIAPDVLARLNDAARQANAALAAPTTTQHGGTD